MQDAGPGRDTQKILDMVEEATVVITAEMERELAALKKMLAEGESGNSELISKLEQSLGDLLAKAGTGAALAQGHSPKGPSPSAGAQGAVLKSPGPRARGQGREPKSSGPRAQAQEPDMFANCLYSLT